ncbi:MAG: helix-turn-helix domain-containing protein [Oscillospiraceae bacterium]|nr:helix-turn-helix domain-containing protein [Oscillospiraceae bacterium]
MQAIEQTLERLNSITGIPLSLLDGEGHLLRTWPDTAAAAPRTEAGAAVIADFRLQKRDALHPLISFLDPGFLLGVAEIDPARYVLIGLVSPYVHSRADILAMVGDAIHPTQLQSYCDMLMKQPLVSLEKLKDLLCLLTALLGREVPEGNILFVDNVSSRKLGASLLDQSLFEQREEAEFHVPTDYETALCSAVEAGDRALLERSLFAPVRGRIGRMSANELRQQKYSFICMATLTSRAAIRGGLNAETAFSLSDLYCQRADLLTEVPLIQNLTFTMLMDFCSKVREVKKRSDTSPIIQNCLGYISVHLHEPITLEQLSRHCGLCTRSLSLRFREEMGMGIPEYIHREKLREAEYLLRHTEYSLSEITVYLNYPSQSYFTQIFKKYRGRTPQQFRDGR